MGLVYDMTLVPRKGCLPTYFHDKGAQRLTEVIFYWGTYPFLGFYLYECIHFQSYFFTWEKWGHGDSDPTVPTKSSLGPVTISSCSLPCPASKSLWEHGTQEHSTAQHSTGFARPSWRGGKTISSNKCLSFPSLPQNWRHECKWLKWLKTFSFLLQSQEEERVNDMQNHGKLVISLTPNFSVTIMKALMLQKMPEASFDPEVSLEL